MIYAYFRAAWETQCCCLRQSRGDRTRDHKRTSNYVTVLIPVRLLSLRKSCLRLFRDPISCGMLPSRQLEARLTTSTLVKQHTQWIFPDEYHVTTKNIPEQTTGKSIVRLTLTPILSKRQMGGAIIPSSYTLVFGSCTTYAIIRGARKEIGQSHASQGVRDGTPFFSGVGVCTLLFSSIRMQDGKH